jgi:hypothetical protein
VRFRFHLTNGSLYAFWVSPTPAGASNGYVLGGGPGFTAHADTVGRGSYPDNHSPFANASEDQTVRDTDGDAHQRVTLDAGKSLDNDGKVDTFTWLIEENQIATGEKADVELPVGTHTITLSVKDDRGASGFDNITVTIQHLWPGVLSTCRRLGESVWRRRRSAGHDQHAHAAGLGHEASDWVAVGDVCRS